jgi:hypothetical protein
MKRAVRTLVLVVAVACSVLATAAPISTTVGIAGIPTCGPNCR